MRKRMRVASRRASKYGLEIALLILMAATRALVMWQDVLLRRTLVIEPTNAARFAGRVYGDQEMGGDSAGRLNSDAALA